MPASAELRFRAACPGDAQATAALHAGSVTTVAPSPTPSSTITPFGTHRNDSVLTGIADQLAAR